MRRIVPVFVAALLLAAFAGPAASAETSSTWHRDNLGKGHERLVCTATGALWTCRYDARPISQNDQGTAGGQFRGTVMESPPAFCPMEWAPLVCEKAIRFVVGATIYGQTDTIWQELIFTNETNGLAPMYQFLVGPKGYPFPAICPWYRTWTQALTHEHDCFTPY